MMLRNRTMCHWLLRYTSIDTLFGLSTVMIRFKLVEMLFRLLGGVLNIGLLILLPLSWILYSWIKQNKNIIWTRSCIRTSGESRSTFQQYDTSDQLTKYLVLNKVSLELRFYWDIDIYVIIIWKSLEYVRQNWQ